MVCYGYAASKAAVIHMVRQAARPRRATSPGRRMRSTATRSCRRKPTSARRRYRAAGRGGSGSHPLVVGDEAGEVAVELERRGEVDGVEGPELGRHERPGGDED